MITAVIFIPLAGALLIFLCAHGGENRAAWIARCIACFASLVCFVVSLLLLREFNPADPKFQLVERHEWIPQFNIYYLLGVDGISIWFIVASAFLTSLCIFSTFKSITTRVKELMIAILVLETMMIGMFAALDLVLFYLFFEGVLIPMFLIVGVWGGKGRIYAAYKFFLYTFAGSVLMLVALITMVVQAGTADMTVMAKSGFPFEIARFLWLGFFIGFAVKTPMWPFHTWLPYAHVEAPTAGSVILAGVLLKMGGYGLIRINLQLLPEASHYFLPFILALSIVAIIYTSLIALVQTDLKRLIAYSSVAHMGYVTLGIFLGNQQGLEGAMMVMLSHTLVSGALFFCVGVAYDRLHTREIARYGGLANNMPNYALLFMVFMLASIGLPGTSGFVGEFLSMQGAFQYSENVAAFAALGAILGAAYMLWMYRRVFYGTAASSDTASMPDLTRSEILILAPLAILILWIGIYPNGIKKIIAPTALKIVQDYHMNSKVVRP